MANTLHLTAIRRRIAGAFLFFFLLSIVMFPLFYNVKITEFHPDETIILLQSKYFKLLMLDGKPWQTFANDPNNARWVLTTLIDHPCVGKRIFIAASNLLGYKIEDLNLIRWNFLKDKEYNLLRNTVPPKNLLYYYRYVSASFSILSCLLIFLIGRKIASNYTGTVAAIAMAYHPLMISSSTRAMLDGFLIFFICLFVYMIVLFLASLSKTRFIQSILISALAGIIASLAVETKFNGGLTYIFFVVLCLFTLSLRFLSKLKAKDYSFASIFKDRYTGVIIFSVFIFTMAAFATLIVVDPYISHDPIQNIRHMLAHRLEVVELQRGAFNAGLYSVKERIMFIWKTLFSPGGKLTLLDNGYNIPIYLILILAGAFLMLKDEIIHIVNNGFCSQRIIVLLWFFITLVVLLHLLLLGWDRYLLPLLPSMSLLLGYSVGNLYSVAKKRLALNRSTAGCLIL